MSLTLYQIMGDNMLIYAKRLANGDVNTTVVDEESSRVVFCETGHPAAWDALVYFAKQIIDEDKRINQFEIDAFNKQLNIEEMKINALIAEQLQGQHYD